MGADGVVVDPPSLDDPPRLGKRVNVRSLRRYCVRFWHELPDAFSRPPGGLSGLRARCQRFVRRCLTIPGDMATRPTAGVSCALP